MNIFRLGVAVASTWGALTFALINRPSVAQPAAPNSSQTDSPVWTYQIDGSTLDQYLNAWAAADGAVQTPVGTARLRQLRTDIRDDELIVSGTADTGWLSVPVDAAAAASVQGGTVEVHIVDAHIKGVDMPDGPRAQIEHQLQSQLSLSLAAYHVSVRSVQLANGKLVVTGTRF